ncbi:class I tRNA ligase family protein [Hydrogenobacter hydrogenophilus]|uniref:leucine--tRNA ligase n=1 Tax=Hydrogenobacter hydrogenophilus TaxID=35835 RepID=A0A285NY75_9AQUI|nr:class I tRNA ligase family protein [Hydrogenobacter hydrogenophilus]SNZ14435.1 leucyl-tRNA synthetase [Hydrogenobacter hydrogenophilus]
MRIGDFLKEHKLSVGDNVRFLFEKLGIHDEKLLKDIENQIGEPAKMSKSKANTVDPEDAIKTYGADTVRLYILFAGPVEKDFEWTDEGVQGAYRFLKRLWNYFHENLEKLRSISYSQERLKNLQGQARDVRRKTHQTLKRYLTDMEELSFNTAIAGIMELLNYLQDYQPQGEEDYAVLREAFEVILFMLYPITPHICEELWHRLGYPKPMCFYPFPKPDETALKVEEFEIPVQINGKLRAVITLPVDADEEVAKSTALSNEKIRKFIDGKEIKKVIYVKNKLLNLVIKDD